MALITYNDKVLVEERPEVAEINKITAGNMNELKSGVNSLDTTRLKKAGDIMTGALTLASNMQPDALTGGGLHCQNSNITGANTILFSNGEGSSTRGLQFVRGSKSDSLWVNNGTLNFTVGRDLGTDNTGTNNIVIHSGVVQDILNSSSTVYPLSANQGRVLDGKIAKAISSPNETSLYTETLSKADFDALVSAGTLIPNTIYNITEGSIIDQT